MLPKFTTITDISLPLSVSTIVYPGNPRIEFESIKSASSSSQLTKITFGSHTGTHIDAPLHVFPNGKSVDELNLSLFIGECRVIDFTKVKTKITVSDLSSKSIKKGERILFKTSNSARGYKTFYANYVYLDGPAAVYLASLEVSLVGIDYLSVKQRGSVDNSPHTALLSKNIPILEGVNLNEVTDGNYYLIALPLTFEGLDGSPVHAVLLK